MSNNMVGSVYAQIISDVIECSRVDFEEGGVEEGALEELRGGWQQKLSQLGVASFPWDPKQEPAPIPNPPVVPSNSGNYQSMSTPPVSTPQSGIPMNQPQSLNGAPRIKPEPGLESPGIPNNIMPPQPQHQGYQPNITVPHQNQNQNIAQQRAAQHLQASFGSRAAASINAIQGGPGQNPGQQSQNGHGQQQPTMQQMQQMQQAQMMHQQQQRAAAHGAMQVQAAHGSQQSMQGGQSLPNRGQQQPQITQEQYNRIMAQEAARQQAAAAQRMQQQQQQQQVAQNGVGGAQTDGAGDEMEVEAFGVVKRFAADGQEIPMGRVEIDGLLHARIEAMGRRMEGGGLMLPLHQASTPSSRRAQKALNKSKKNTSGKGKEVGRGVIGGGDAADDDDDDDEDERVTADEDAINSDLDDPDDALDGDEDEDGDMGNIMLCMYDKVQRVKNKWKCVMKDGVLTVNNKEYVFHKATGEYEW